MQASAAAIDIDTIERPFAAHAPASTAARTPMRAAVLAGPREIRIEERACPQPAPDEVRVRLEGCGVCASNLEPWTGLPWTSYPFEPGAPGHEGWGVIDAVGERVTRRRPGDRVAILAGHAYAEYDVAREDCTVVLPPALEGLPFPAEPLACAVNIFARSGICPGEDVAIVGTGFLGLVLTRLATRIGANVVAISRRPFALAEARKQGAAATVVMDDRAFVVREVHALTGGAGCRRVIEATGRQEPLDLAAELCAERGTLVIAGYHQDGPRTVNMQLWNWRGLDVVNAHERDPRVYARGMQEAIRLAADGEIDIESLLTHRFPLDNLADALTLTEQRPDGFLKAWVHP
jgi:2-desacetyl-2-hydroxyethyl bacteriochlorophyllide A dehydrogenase